METELIRKTIGRRREEKTVIEQVRWLNEQLEQLGIKLTNDDYLVRKVFVRPRKSTASQTNPGGII
jgi:hypothetical protein